MTEINKIKKALPHIADDEVIVSLAEAFDNAKQLHAMAESEAGQKLSKELWTKSMDIVGTLRNSYEHCSEMELRTLCAALHTQMTLHEELVSSGFLVDVAKDELDKTIYEIG